MFRYTRPLKLGDRGQDVREVQERLNTLGFDAGLEDGIFGESTRQAVMQFQRSKGLTPDGIVGPNTYTALLGVGGKARIVINLSERKLYLYLDNQLHRTFPVAIGKPATPSPTGTFKITEKAPNPGGVFGTRWMRFYKDYGIHGTNNPASIGKAVSNGCIRMHNADVNYVYSLVPIGTEVSVVSSQATDRYYVVQAGDTLFSISQKLGVNYDALLRENSITDPNMIYVGQKLLIPR
ncbi:MAG: hypothetical protein K0R93_3446 [Anaerosolibacter sp.]|uniref:L,D-transpeptidase family protein n=1 Tax=Anaerosolibacter sp. TaxID=1872527 RepID=UPI00261D88E8|nr:L,D-transpeptidase family protein [Anaerosolibacter sp.]MDF2548548.1 hypothetical protein [Anaerosolibacter sp.]